MNWLTHLFIFSDTVLCLCHKINDRPAETSCRFKMTKLWTKTSDCHFLRAGSWCQQTSVKGEPHILYVLGEARHSVETFRFHTWKRKSQKLVSVFFFWRGCGFFQPTSHLCAVFQTSPLASISWMHMSTTMGRVALWALTSVVRSQLNTFFILRRSGWQSLGTSLEHCLCTFSPQSKSKSKINTEGERD